MVARQNGKKALFFLPQVESLELRIVLDERTAGLFGINARLLTTPSGVALTGSDTAIGQVEIGRPNNPLLDAINHRHVRPQGVYYKDGPSFAGRNIRPHALQVAGVMIANGPTNTGIARDARLFSSASGVELFTVQRDALLAAQHVKSIGLAATRIPGMAINHSYTIGNLIGNVNADGDSLITLGLDWLASQRMVLNVFVGGNDPDEWGVPSDAYNGIVVGETTTSIVNGQPVYRRFSTGNVNPAPRDAEHDRSLITLVAPGDPIWVPHIDASGTSRYTSVDGTSFAAPHVTGTVALLQQYARDRESANAQGWDNETINSSPLVMKAVLLNSADKIEGHLGMEKTIVKRDGTTTWIQTQAYTDAAVPLDDELGAGQLNARRALNQFSSGAVEFLNNDGTPKPVPVVGWTWRSMPEGTDAFDKFVFSEPLKANSYLSVTLCWNRVVHLPGDSNGLYDPGEQFAGESPRNFDLYVLPRGATSITQAVWRSTSTQYNVEHVFAGVLAGGEYEFWVRRSGNVPYHHSYAVAWWGVPADPDPATVATIGDKVWEDQGPNPNGIQDPGEPGISGVRLYLHQANGHYVSTTITDVNGNYQFRAPPGLYYISIAPPRDMRFTVKAVGALRNIDSDVDDNGYTGVFSLPAGGDLWIDAGLVRTGAVGGQAWLENLADGIRLAREPPAANVAVTLFTESGDWVDRILTDSEGNYQFDSIDPGNYYVNFGRVPGRQFTLKDQSTDDIDSDVELSTGNSHVFTVDYYGNVADVDAGYEYNPVNNSPQGADNVIELCEDEIYAFAEYDFGFSDPNDLPPHNFKAIIVQSLPMVGSLTLNGDPVAVHDIIDVADFEDGNFLYIPPANQYGEALASWQFAVQDDGGNFAEGGGDVDLTPNTITFDVHSTPDAPLGVDGVLTLAAGSTYTFTVGDFGFSDPNDVPADNLYSVIVAALPTVGTLSLNGIPVALGAEIYAWQIAGGSFQYTAPIGLYGTPLTSFDFGLRDDGWSEWCEGEVYSPSAYTILIHVPQNPGTPSVSINDISQYEGNNGTSYFGFSVSLSATPSQVVTLNYSTAGNSATPFADYGPVTGMLTFFPGGPTSQIIYVPVYGDLAQEPNETFFVNLSNVMNAFVLDNQGLGTIVNDDWLPPPPPPQPEQPSVSINDIIQVEGNSGTTSFVFTVALSGPTSQTVTLNYATANGTATATEDYGAVGGPITFMPGGPLTQTISVPVYGDHNCEADETFFVNLSNVVNATVTDGQGKGTIEDDDTLWATTVIDYSSQWSAGSWSAAQALGKPNTFAYGDIYTAWAPLPRNGTLEYITLGFAQAVYATGVTIRETYGNGFVYRLDLRDTSGGWHTVWTGTDPSQSGAPVDFAIPFATTPYLVDAVKIYTDTNHNLNAWEEIDAVKLHDEHCPPGGGGSEATIKGTVWDDFDADGFQDLGESAFAGLIVELRNSIGQLVATTTTDSAGNYQFNNVAPGTYYLVFQKPFGYNFTLQDQGDDNFDSDVNFDGLTAYFSLFENETKDFEAGLIFGMP
ncbi:MAG: carboxypeptidase regulatory-like domain-containing protein [Gemmataceae bacterium]|nr:carboxypeptidase regulatory-like domain-containing protein [Gemmataceae bacterium]